MMSYVLNAYPDVHREVPLGRLLLQPVFAAPHVDASLRSHKEDLKPDRDNLSEKSLRQLIPKGRASFLRCIEQNKARL